MSDPRHSLLEMVREKVLGQSPLPRLQEGQENVLPKADERQEVLPYAFQLRRHQGWILKAVNKLFSECFI